MGAAHAGGQRIAAGCRQPVRSGAPSPIREWGRTHRAAAHPGLDAGGRPRHRAPRRGAPAPMSAAPTSWPRSHRRRRWCDTIITESLEGGLDCDCARAGRASLARAGSAARRD